MFVEFVVKGVESKHKLAFLLPEFYDNSSVNDTRRS